MALRHDAADDTAVDTGCPGRCTLGFAEVEGGDVMPCPQHRAEQHARWAAGAFRPTPWAWFRDLATT